MTPDDEKRIRTLEAGIEKPLVSWALTELLAEIDALREQNKQDCVAMNAENDRHIERISVLEKELAEAKAEIHSACQALQDEQSE